MLVNCIGPTDWVAGGDCDWKRASTGRLGGQDDVLDLVGGDVVRPAAPLVDPFEGVGVPGSMIDPNWGCGCVVVANGEGASGGRVAVLMGGGEGCCENRFIRSSTGFVLLLPDPF